jgi:uncharacterized DUF497 family protein
MKPFRWNHAKNERLKLERQISFEEMVLAIEDGGLLHVLRHRNAVKYPHQRLLVVALDGYAYLVPFVEARVLLLENHYPEPQGNPGLPAARWA